MGPADSKLVGCSGSNACHLGFDFNVFQGSDCQFGVDQNGSETEVDFMWSDIRSALREAYEDRLADVAVEVLNENSERFDELWSCICYVGQLLAHIMRSAPPGDDVFTSRDFKETMADIFKMFGFHYQK